MTKPRHSPPRIEDKDLLELLGKARMASSSSPACMGRDRVIGLWLARSSRTSTSWRRSSRAIRLYFHSQGTLCAAAPHYRSKE